MLEGPVEEVHLTLAYNLMNDMDSSINYRVPEKFMDEHKGAPGDFWQNRESFLIRANIEMLLVSIIILLFMYTHFKVE